jgi:hypothetical protein
MRLVDSIAEMLGAEIQQHEIKVGSKIKTFFFRQFDDFTGRDIFKPRDGESTEDRGTRVMHALIAASACDESGVLTSTPDEVAALKSSVKNVLFEKAALTNNIALNSDTTTDGGDSESEAKKV